MHLQAVLNIVTLFGTHQLYWLGVDILQCLVDMVQYRQSVVELMQQEEHIG